MRSVVVVCMVDTVGTVVVDDIVVVAAVGIVVVVVVVFQPFELTQQPRSLYAIWVKVMVSLSSRLQ